MAEQIKKYRPSNGSEGAWFMDQFCDRCTKDKHDHQTGEGGCQIMLDTMRFDVCDKQYPNEWTFDEDGKSICTAFEKDRC